MQPPAMRANEAERIAALRSHEILDTPAEPRFDALTQLAAKILEVPIALITFVDADREWFKSGHGIGARETPRDVSFSGHVVAAQAPLVVPDTVQDPRFVDNPRVTGDPRVRFYAGVPLLTPDGFVIGTFCAIDHEPREPTEAEVDMLELLAGQVVEILGARQSERELSRFRAALDRTKEAILIFDPTSLRFTYANRGAASQLGCAVDELLHKTPLDFAPLLDEPRYRKVLEPLIAGQSEVTSFETVHRHKDGHDIPVEIVLQYLAAAGEEPRFLTIIRDISERKHVDKLKSEFISMVSHELRTPLTSLRGSLGLVANGIAGPLPSQAQEYVDIALSNSERLVSLINDILDIEKIQSGRTDLRLEPVDLVNAMKKALTANEAYAAARNVTLSFIEEVPDIEVFVDEDRLLQVLGNLISNAAKFSNAGQSVELSMVKRNNRIRVNIRDHGPGISEEFAQRIFQRFVQEDSSNTRTKGGTGLSLSMTKALVEAMRGKIGFEKTPGHGTTFFFDLPTLPPGPENANPSEGDDDKQVLVCEDDLDTARLIKKLLEQVAAAFT